jgi:hypothetical protein
MLSTTSVGFCIAACRITRAEKKIIEQLLRLNYL